MPKRHQQRPAKERVGRNNPKKSTVITTGTYKKPETYEEQAAEHKDSGKIAQYEKVPPTLDIPSGVTRQGDSQEMEELGERRSGSDSNADKHRKGSRLHESAQREPHPQHEDLSSYDTEDLRPDNFAGGNYGLRSAPQDLGLTAYDIKELHDKLADLTDDELKNIVILTTGTRLEQGATYIDLQHLEQGEFTATADMMADEDHYYVPKKDTDYVLWNRLNQVTNPARLDESGTANG